MASNPIIDRPADSLQTSAASLTTLLTYTPPANDLAFKVHWHAVGRETVSGEISSVERIAAFENTSGTMAQVGTGDSLHDEDEDTNVVFQESASGNTILLEVTPAVDTTDWSVWAEITVLQT